MKENEQIQGEQVFNTNENSSTIGDKKMETAYKLASSLVRDRLESENEENIEILNEMKDDDVICIDGQYDHIHLVLKHSGIPFTQISPDNIGELKLRPDQTIFVNCIGSFPPEMARKLAGFVADGGQLITTDWCLRSVIEVAFPGTIKYNNSPTSDEVVRIEILDKDDSILKGFLDEEADPQWWLEGSSYPIKIIDHEKVKILIKSNQLKDKYGEEAVIVRFEHGKGVVYHMISHFYLQRTETRDAKHTQKASMYSMSKGSSPSVQAMFESTEEATGVNYGEVQSAGTSAEFVSRALLNQKKKFRKK